MSSKNKNRYHVDKYYTGTMFADLYPWCMYTVQHTV
jgi:hypothetical protein